MVGYCCTLADRLEEAKQSNETMFTYSQRFGSSIGVVCVDCVAIGAVFCVANVIVVTQGGAGAG